MATRFCCPTCGKLYVYKPEFAGKRAKCTCGTRFVIPEDVTPSRSAKSDIAAEEAAPAPPAGVPAAEQGPTNPQPAPPAQGIADLIEAVYRAKTWMRVIAVLSIISGVLAALSIYGIIFAWLPIWLGVVLYQAVGRIEESHASQNRALFLVGLSKISTYFTIQGVVQLVILLLVLVVFIVAILSAFAGRL